MRLRRPVPYVFARLCILGKPASIIRPRFLSTPTVKISGNVPEGGKGVRVGQFAQVGRVFTTADVQAYAALVVDNNPLHQSWNRDELTKDFHDHPLVYWEDSSSTDKSQTKVLVHGMLGASLFSCIFGSHIHGAVYLSQRLKFAKPIFAEERVLGRVTITNIVPRNSKGVVITCETTVTRDEDVCISGDAKVWLVNGFVAKENA